MKSQKDFQSAVSLLEDHLWLYHKGLSYHYRGIANQLWYLLCDTKKDKILIKRIFPDIEFHPVLGNSPDKNKEGTMNKIRDLLGDDYDLFPGLILGTKNSTPRVIGLFDVKQATMKMENWMNQPLLNPKISIRNIITAVRNGEAAHPDPEYNETLGRAKSFRPADIPSDELSIVSIGEYVFSQIQSHTRAHISKSKLTKENKVKYLDK